MEIQLARLFLDIQEGLTDQDDYYFLLDFIEGLTGISQSDVEEFIHENYEEIITWEP